MEYRFNAAALPQPLARETAREISLTPQISSLARYRGGDLVGQQPRGRWLAQTCRDDRQFARAHSAASLAMG
jgi:hypothetical protein